MSLNLKAGIVSTVVKEDDRFGRLIVRAPGAHGEEPSRCYLTLAFLM